MENEFKPEKVQGNGYEPEMHLVVFKLGAEEYGIKIEQVKEVTVTPDIAKMPQTPSFIKGVSSIRGDIIAIMDLADRFNIKSVESGQRRVSRNTYTLVIEGPGYTMGLIVNEVPQTASVPLSSIDRTPNIIAQKNINENYIEGIGKLGGRLIIILDLFKILSAEEIKQLQSSAV